ncbi:sigma-70 family RNA polymerase sigma factor [Pseudooceanicola nanhaiensis]|uniref:sigma-70 family RNA polymerase sigma factor n=1 Tax=Pseudooceanicola nanhaiensis TaxID=375761 RepID=UPI001CD7F728|nr:sigma-70 family RNA polymerase sigma factor [Pseudooceanicola nanhaiensis]MCA0921107.1 sigma-70 family RNA polymerase sigma factor [Pseudooceanicola nanhaiensis]
MERAGTAALEELEDLLARTAMGDRAAFGRLYQLTSAKLFGVCLRILSREQEAEDALQEIYVKIWCNADRYRVVGYSPMTWLITIARNHAIDRLRKRRAAGTSLDQAEDVPDGTPNPEASAIASSDRAQLLRCFGELERDRSDAVQRAYLLGETYAELAKRFDVPVNTMRTWLRRSLIKLRECLTR